MRKKLLGGVMVKAFLPCVAISILEGKIKDMEKELEAQQKDKDVHQCKKCEYIFHKKSDLVLHIKEKHGKLIKCKLCDETFEKTFELEKHLKTNGAEKLTCETCEKTFSLQWRLEKHKKGHDKANAKYYNCQKLCPLEEIGCMYIHENSHPCRFHKSCQNKLCQFQHFDVNLVSGIKDRENLDGTEAVQSEIESENRTYEKMKKSSGMKKACLSG